jgi:tRNA(Ile)-lysidine synthase
VLTREARLRRGEVVLVAVSGGPDSMALLDVCARLAPELGVSVVAHGVDHGLRAEAAGELDLAAREAERRGVRFARTTLTIAPGGNVMARARDARWAALRAAAAAAGAARIATAHHADDRAETVLIRVLRGVGREGLGVLAPVEGDRLRPLVRARRSDVMAHISRHQIPFASDPTNVDPRFLRTRVRHELLPLMLELNPRAVEHLARLADGDTGRDLSAFHPPFADDEPTDEPDATALAREIDGASER